MPKKTKARKTKPAVEEERPGVKKTSAKKKNSFPIVGIGASAGGLEAIEQFLKGVPENPGMAFVVVQHLDPDYKGFMPELLQRATPMKVIQVTDRTKVQPDQVYVIPPNRDMSLLHGYLHLMEPREPRGLRLPIDFFFTSLAQDLEERSIGAILSGMGTDGTIGMRAIREKGGLTLVQDPSSAKFDNMPRSAIETGLIDIVAGPEDLPKKIIDFVRLAPLFRAPKLSIEEKTKSALEKIFILLRTHTGHDFSMYKKSMVYRRIERRMGIHQIDKIALYFRFLQENPRELDLLFKELLIGVTNFFRDPKVWDYLRDKALPSVIEGSPDGRVLRAWVAGCSSGEEAYSLAIVFREALDKLKPKGRITLQVYATDLDPDAIDKARAAFYPENIVADVTPERLNRFFRKEETGGYRIVKEIREMVVFAQQNLIMDPPFTKLDVLSCRNLLIYLEPEIQRKLLPLFNYSLNPGGILVLGNAETISGFSNLFVPIDPKMKIFRRKEPILLSEPVEFPTGFFPSRAGIPQLSRVAKPVLNLQILADQLLLQKYSPAAVMTNETGDILYIHGKTGRYLEPPAGKANWNIFAMAREGLRYDLNNAFQQAVRKKEDVSVKGVTVELDHGIHQQVDVSVHVISEPPDLKGNVMVVLSDSEIHRMKPEPALRSVAVTAKGEQVDELQVELQQSREELQSLREEMQTSQEELKSTNEELQSTNEELQSMNEELQSTNEELTTSKEEMQSLNEELQTVNTELQSRVEELSRANNDMKNLLNSTDIATLFLDADLNVRRFTAKATNIIRLIPGDVGRPVTDISSDLIYPGLTEDAREVLQTLVFSEKVVPTKDGRQFSVRIMPYRTLENKIDGVVITFIDLTSHKKLEEDLASSSELAEALVTAIRESVLIIDDDMNVVSANQSYMNHFRIGKERVEGKSLFAIGDRRWDNPALKKQIEKLHTDHTPFENFRVEYQRPGAGFKVVMVSGKEINADEKGNKRILLVINPFTSHENTHKLVPKNPERKPFLD